MILPEELRHMSAYVRGFPLHPYASKRHFDKFSSKCTGYGFTDRCLPDFRVDRQNRVWSVLICLFLSLKSRLFPFIFSSTTDSSFVSSTIRDRSFITADIQEFSFISEVRNDLRRVPRGLR